MARQADAAAIERIKAAREKSLKIMQMDMNGSLGKIAESKRNSIAEAVNGAEPKYATNPPQGTVPQVNNTVRPMQRTTFGPSASKLPSAILESFKTNPGGDDNEMMRQVMTGSNDLAFLDEMAVQRKQAVRETVQQPQVQTTAQVSAGIDYPMIRTIVEEIVRKYASSIAKKVINESKGSNASTVNTMMLGEKFKFLTDDGDIYECTMKRVGNVKDRKKNVNG
jgi:hypothetical protein